MQNPQARSGIAWCSPPPGWWACSTSPRRIASIARSEPAATVAPASCMPVNAGLSDRPMPIAPAPVGSTENRRTASTYAGRWIRSSSSSVAGSGASPGSAPTARSRSIPGPNRFGVSGWCGPKSYASERGPKTRSGPPPVLPGIRARYRHGARVHDAAARQARRQAGDARRARRPRGRRVRGGAARPDPRRHARRAAPGHRHRPVRGRLASRRSTGCRRSGSASFPTARSGSCRARARRRRSATWT